MAKFNKKQIEVHKRFLTIADMETIARKYKMHSHTLKRALWGEMHYDTGSKERQAMIVEAGQLVHKRATEAIEVIDQQQIKG